MGKEDKVQTMEPLRVLAVRDNNESFLKNAASGGAFSILARSVLSRGGVVFGAAYESGGKVGHRMVDSMDELPSLQGSKYVQSDIGDTFGECLRQLLSGAIVLYSGLPCQIFALKSYIASRSTDNFDGQLLTCDLICHGVITPSLFARYISWLERKKRAVPGSLKYSFRPKEEGWEQTLYYRFTYLTQRGQRVKVESGPALDDPYYRAFLSSNYYRESCYSCRFACKQRIGDFTIGDYWGIEKAHPELNSPLGASVLMLNSEEAQAFFSEYCSSDCTWIESTFEAASLENENLKRPSRRNREGLENATKVFQALKDENVDYIFDNLLKERGVKAAVLRLLPKTILKYLRRLLQGV